MRESVIRDRAPLESSSQPLALLLGAGHAHLYPLAHAREYGLHGCAVAVVAPGRFWYSGLATGMLGGMYAPEQDQIDVEGLASANGARVLAPRADRIDPKDGTVRVAGGATLRYDVLSLNVGSIVEPLPGSHGNSAVYPVKPIERLCVLREHLTARFAGTPVWETSRRTTEAAEAQVRGQEARQPSRTVRIVIAGGGQTGCELAVNIVALAEQYGAPAAVTLVTSGSRVLEALPCAAARAVEAFLERRGVAVRRDTRISGIDGRLARLSNGSALEFDALVNATGLKPPPLIAESGLPVDSDGALLVDAHLRSVGDQRVFGGGDCIAIEGQPLPKIGVYAVRQGPVLHRNLLAAVQGEPLTPFRPQRRFLSIMNFGDGTAFAIRNGCWHHGRIAFRLKDTIDRRFLKRYRRAGGGVRV